MLSRKGKQTYQSAVLPGNGPLEANVNKIKNGLVSFNPLQYTGGSIKSIGKSIGKSLSKVAKEATPVVKTIATDVSKQLANKVVVPQLAKYGNQIVGNYLMPAAQDAALAAVETAAGRKRKGSGLGRPTLPIGLSHGGAAPKNLSRWVEHVKAYQTKHNVTYRQALQQASASYHKNK